MYFCIIKLTILKVTTMELSIKERALVSKVLATVKDVMTPDPDFDFVDNGNFLLSLDKDEMKTLKKLLKIL